MPDNDDNADKKVKDLIDDATRAELDRWFGLPSFEQLAEQAKPAAPPEDPELDEFRRRAAEAVAAVDPTLLELLYRRAEPPEDLLRSRQVIELRIDPGMAMFDQGMIDRQHLIAEPREIEVPQRLIDDIHESAPQALLRDLHRPDRTFDNTREVVDPIGEVRLDITALVAEAMTPRKIEMLASTFREANALIAELRAERRRPWTEIEMPNRRVSQ
jgi:hypothetical protein